MFKRIALRINEIFISSCAAAIETSSCVWACTILPLIPLVYPASLLLVQFISSGFLQLVALPVLGVSNKRQAEALAKQSKEQHDTVMDILGTVHQLVIDVKQLHDDLHAKLYEEKPR